MSEVAVADVLDLLADEYTRAILLATKREPMAAKDLSEHCSMSRPTVYRRVERLVELDLLVERTAIDPESGNHHSVYEANLERALIQLGSEGFEVEIGRLEDVADRFTRLWEGVREG